MKRLVPSLNRALALLGVSLFIVGLLMVWPYGFAFMAGPAQIVDPPNDTPTPVDDSTATPEEFPSPTPWPTDTPEEPTLIPTLDLPTETPEPILTPTELAPQPTVTSTQNPAKTPTPTANVPGSPTAGPNPTSSPRTRPSPEPTRAPIGTYLIIDPIDPVAVGKHPDITVHLYGVGGWPIANQSVQLMLGEVHVRQARTDAAGAAVLMLQLDLPVGVYTLEAVFNGARSLYLAPSVAFTQVEIVSTAVEIHIVPPLPGINFSLADHLFTSDANGIARVDVSQVGLYPLELLPLESPSPEMQLEFLRWADESFSVKRDVKVPLKKPLELGLGVKYQVSLSFVDREAQLVPPERVTGLMLKGSDGNAYSFTDFTLHWLSANRIARRVDGLEVTPIQYSVDSVMIDGSNVVNTSQQRFYLKPNDLWIIQVLLYSAHFTARDALFGFPMGTGVRLEYPDGHRQDFSFGSGRDLQLSALARGLYRVTVLGVEGQGLSFPTPVALSRDQDVSLLIISLLDMGLGFTLMAVLALGLLFGGRPHLLLPLLSLWPKLRVGKPHG